MRLAAAAILLIVKAFAPPWAKGCVSTNGNYRQCIRLADKDAGLIYLRKCPLRVLRLPLELPPNHVPVLALTAPISVA